MRTLPLLLALTVLPTLAGAQSQAGGGRPNTRQGFWIGFGFGPGSAGADCDSGCSNEGLSGFSGYFRMGGTVSPKVLLGGESNAWARSHDNGVDETLGFASFIVMWYPSATGAFYLKAGLGAMSYEVTDGTDELTATAPSVSFGLGYEIRVSRNMSVVPFFNGMATSAVEFKFNGQTLPNSNEVKVSLAQLGVGLTWH
jgi:hypothetical protein